MTITVHRREYAIFAGEYRCATWIDLDFAPVDGQTLPSEWLSEGDDFLHQTVPLPPVEVECPIGSKLVERQTGRGPATRLAYHADPYGIDAAAVYYLAMLGERGFRVARKRQEDGQLGLFGAEPGPAGVGAYGRPADIPAVPGCIPKSAPDIPPGDPVPFGRSGAAIDRAERLERAIREALPWLDEDAGICYRPLTAANILREALGDDDGSAQARAG